MAPRNLLGKTIVVSGITLLFGLGLGAFAMAEIAPPMIVTKTVTGPTVTVAVPGPAVVPQSCRDALTAGEAADVTQGLLDDRVSKIGGFSSDMINALEANDAARIAFIKTEANSLPPAPSIGRLTSEIDAYVALAQKCRAS
jgi:hypothetical protein